jgi:hypothetical protein
MGPMQVGSKRSDVEYVWPSQLWRPRTKIVYLDLNHWISLAKANVKHPQGDEYLPALEAIRSAALAGDAVFPLSATHYMEMTGIANPRQRADLAEVMGEVSGFVSLLDRVLISKAEVEAMLDVMVAPHPKEYMPLMLLGDGVGHAFGRKVDRVGVRDSSGDITEQMRADWPAGPAAFDALMQTAQREIEQGVLRGPADEDIPRLVGDYGYVPEPVREQQRKRATQEGEQAERLDGHPEWRRGRIRDVVGCRYLIFELMELINEGLAARRSDTSSFRDAASLRRLIDGMPSADASVTLLTEYHRNSRMRWESNDISDIDALSAAVAYCDVVVTDSKARHLIEVTGLSRRLNVKVVSRLSDLLSIIEGLGQP